MRLKNLLSVAVVFALLAPAFAGPGSSSGGSSSRPSSGGGFSGGSSSKPAGSGFSGGSKPASSSKPAGSGFSGGSSGGSKPVASKPAGSGFSGGSSSKPPVKTSEPLPDRTPKSVSKKPAASDFNSLAVADSKKAESRRNYEQAKEPAKTYKTASGAERKIDPKDKEIEHLRGKLDKQKWSDRSARESSFYSGYASRPVVAYSDPYHPLLTYWILSQALDTQALWAYHHRDSMDKARLESMYAQNANLRARVDALESQKLARDPTYAPPGLDDLAYSDSYVDAAFNPSPSEVDEYEYDDEESGWPTWLVVLLIVLVVVVSIGTFLVYLNDE